MAPRSKPAPEKAARPIRDKAFARRLNEACDGHPHVPPYNYGRLSWVRDHMQEDQAVDVSLETVRKWFAGEARPRPDKMSKLAALLHVDEAWLSLGITPEMAPSERRAFHENATGALNVVAGLIQLSGGHPAFPEEGDPRGKTANLYAIIKGKQIALYVTLGIEEGEGSYRFTVPANANGSVVVGVVPTNPLRCDFVRLDSEMLEKHADKKGGFSEVHVKKDGTDYVTKRDRWEKIKDFKSKV